MGVRSPHLLAIAALGAMTGGCAIAPSPLDDAHLSVKAEERLARVTEDQEPVRGSISLYEAMARALKYNLDYRVEVFQRSLRLQELDLAHYNMLPSVVANTEFAKRDNFAASTSQIVNNGQLGQPGAFQNFNTSQERSRSTADIEFSWHVLDFGLSYVRAQQAADKVMIADEARRKVINRIVEDVRTAFWRAVSADRLVSRLRRLERRTRAALASTRSVANEAQTSPVTALTYERELIEIKRTIQDLQRDLSVAKSQLAALMNLKPGTKFTLSYPRRVHRGLVLPGKVSDMVWTAMHNRPELRDVEYRKRINLKEADAALLEMLPGLKLYAGDNYDSNDFLLNADWLSWGAKASWNLMKLIQYPARKSVIEAQDTLLEKRALAVTMAVMTQIHVARVRFYQAAKELRTAQEYHRVQRRLVESLRAEKAAGRISEQTLLREEMNTLVAEVRRDIAHSRLQNAYANVFASIGLDPYTSEYDAQMSVSALSKSLRRIWRERNRRGWRPKLMTVAAKG